MNFTTLLTCFISYLTCFYQITHQLFTNWLIYIRTEGQSPYQSKYLLLTYLELVNSYTIKLKNNKMILKSIHIIIFRTGQFISHVEQSKNNKYLIPAHCALNWGGFRDLSGSDKTLPKLKAWYGIRPFLPPNIYSDQYPSNLLLMQ